MCGSSVDLVDVGRRLLEAVVVELVGGEEGVFLRRWSCNESGTMAFIGVAYYSTVS